MTHRHHIIPRHEWKMRFKDLRGFNAPDNIVYLTVEQHAHAHQLLYELHGYKYDLIAAQMLRGHIGKEEAMRLVRQAIGAPRPKGFVMSQEHRRAISLASIGKPGTRNGIKSTATQIQRQRESLSRLPKLTCIECGLAGGYCVMKSRHFENCQNPGFLQQLPGIIDEYVAGNTPVKKLAKNHGIQYTFLRQLLRQRGVPIRSGSHSSLTKKQRALLTNDFHIIVSEHQDQNIPLTTLSKKYGFSPSVIIKYYKKYQNTLIVQKALVS